MASIEFLTERIENAQAKIAKKQNTIEKKQKLIEKKVALIEKTEDEHERRWLDYDVRSLNEDIARGTKEIAEIRVSLDKYIAQKNAELEKAASRNVTAIIEFLEGWKTRVTEYYHERFAKFLEERKVRYAENKEYCDFVNTGWYKIEDREAARAARKAASEKEDKARRAFNKKWNFIAPYVNFDTFNDERLAKELEQEANEKYDDIINRTNAICGKIVDAQGLWVGNKGDLDGIVIGERGTAKVQTIGAGGYNIQCFHFRTLVHEVK